MHTAVVGLKFNKSWGVLYSLHCVLGRWLLMGCIPHPTQHLPVQTWQALKGRAVLKWLQPLRLKGCRRREERPRVISCSGMACFTFPSPIRLRSPTRSPIHRRGPSPSQACTGQGTGVSCWNPLLFAAVNF